jgi:hypothetical protein
VFREDQSLQFVPAKDDQSNLTRLKEIIAGLPQASVEDIMQNNLVGNLSEFIILSPRNNSSSYAMFLLFRICFSHNTVIQMDTSWNIIVDAIYSLSITSQLLLSLFLLKLASQEDVIPAVVYDFPRLCHFWKTSLMNPHFPWHEIEENIIDSILSTDMISFLTSLLSSEGLAAFLLVVLAMISLK